ncbi:MAG: ABC transporter ATP-binding protein [Hyphomicrobiales bacterium]
MSQQAPTSLNDNQHVTLSHVSHSYGDNLILDDISLSIERGEIICLLGPSGSGKSTLLRLIAGVETLSKGSITINGQVMVDENVFVPPENRKIGMVFQDYALFPHLTVIQNIMFGIGKNGKISSHQAMEQLKYIGLQSYADNYPNTLSGGQQQRVALARTLATEPQILLLDEPFSGLDAHLREDLRKETKKLIKQQNASAIFVTHDAEEALYLADKIILLNNSKIEQIGTPHKLLNKPVSRFAAQYLRRYNELDVKVDNGQIISPFGSFPLAHVTNNLPQNVENAKLLIAQNDIHLESHDAPDLFDHHIDVKIRHINHYSEFSELYLDVNGKQASLILRTSLREKRVRIGDQYKAHFNYKNLFIF